MIVDTVEQMAAKWHGQNGSLIGLLQEVQSEFNYVPREALPVVARQLDMPLSQVYSVTTFYTSLSLEPRGKHVLTCCLGTACHVRGGPRIVDEAARLFGVAPGETTDDGQFTLETVRCLGTCALAPVVVVDGKYYGKMTPGGLRRLVRALREEEAQ